MSERAVHRTDSFFDQPFALQISAREPFGADCVPKLLDLLPYVGGIAHEARSAGLLASFLLTACGVPDDARFPAAPGGTGPDGRGAVPATVAPPGAPINSSTAAEPLPGAPRSGPRTVSSDNFSDAFTAALSRPFRALSQALEPEKLLASAEHGLARAVVRQARRQAALEAESHGPDEWTTEAEVLARSPGPADFSDLRAPHFFYSEERFAPLRPQIDRLGLVPLLDPDWGSTPLRFDVRLPPGRHFQRAIDGDETWREVLRNIEYKVSVDLSAHGDTVAILVEPESVGIFFTHPITARR